MTGPFLQPQARIAVVSATLITAVLFAIALLITKPPAHQVAPLARLLAAQSSAPMLRGDAIALRRLAEQGLASGGISGIEIIDMNGASLASAGNITASRDDYSEPILLEQTVAGYVRVAAPPSAGQSPQLWLAWLVATAGALLCALLLTRKRAKPAPPAPPAKRFAAVLNLLNHTEMENSAVLESQWAQDIASVTALTGARWQALAGSGFYLEFAGIDGDEALCLTLTALRLCARSAAQPARWRGALLEPGPEAQERGLLYAALADDLSVTMTATVTRELSPEDGRLVAAESPLLDSFGEPLWRLAETGATLEGQVAELTSGLASTSAAPAIG